MTAPPRPSSSICLLRDTAAGCEVLMAQRGAGARFMGGAWVFPGGVVDEIDRGPAALAALDGVVDPEEAAWRATALRELVEEAGFWLGGEPFTLGPEDRPHGADVYEQAAGSRGHFAAGNMAWFSTWVTPTLVPMRFDARFYVAVVPPGVDGVPDGKEMDAIVWISPAAAVARADAGSFLLPFPTRKTLEHFARLGSAHDIVSHARSQPVVPRIQPRLRVTEGGTIEAVLPGDAGFDDLEDLPPDPDALARAGRVQSAKGEPIPELGGR